MTVLGSVVLVLAPAVSKWQATDNQSSIQAVLIHASRYALYFAIPIEFGLITLGRPFLTLWMGPSYADAGFTTLLILSAPLFLASLSIVAVRVLQGIGRVRPQAIIMIIQAATTVALSLALAGPLGIEGVALGISLAVVLCTPATVILACRSVQLGLLSLLTGASWQPLLASAAAVPVWIVAQEFHPIDSWLAFFAIGILGMMPYAIVTLLLERGCPPCCRQYATTACPLAYFSGPSLSGLARNLSITRALFCFDRPNRAICHAPRITSFLRDFVAKHSVTLSGVSSANRVLISRIRSRSLTYLSVKKLNSLADTCRSIEQQQLPGIFLEAGCALADPPF